MASWLKTVKCDRHVPVLQQTRTTIDKQTSDTNVTTSDTSVMVLTFMYVMICLYLSMAIPKQLPELTMPEACRELQTFTHTQCNLLHHAAPV